MKRYIKSSQDSFTSELYDLVEYTVEQFMSEKDEDGEYDIDTSITGFDDEKWFNIYISTSLSYEENEYLMNRLNNAISQNMDIDFGWSDGFDITDAGLDLSIEI